MSVWEKSERENALRKFLKNNKVNLLTGDLDACYEQIVEEIAPNDKRVSEILLIDFTKLLLKSGINPLDFNPKKIYPYQFQDLDLGDLVIPDSVTSIGTQAFMWSKIDSVTFGSKVKTIDENAFADTTLIKLEIPDSVTKIGPFAFGNCLSLENVVFGKGLRTIGENAFTGCKKLKTLYIPKNVTNIGKWAFTSCSLTQVTIPEKFKSRDDLFGRKPGKITFTYI